MKRLDKLILSSFLGPFLLTFVVVVFILLTVHMLKYFDDIVGKGLEWYVIGKLLFFFAIFVTPNAIHLAILLSSLMTFGNLGEHFELTAIKSAGISLLRALRPIFIFVLGMTVFAFYSNNYFVPKAALNAYSLMYDIKQKKPALNLKEGAFYDGIPGFSIKVNKKFEDGQTIKDVIIYNHKDREGNKDVTIADSGKMYTFMDERYLKFELFDGRSYKEGQNASPRAYRPKDKPETLSRYKFKESKFVMDLSSFDIKETKKELFARNRIMRNLSELEIDADSIKDEVLEEKLSHAISFKHLFSSYDFKEDPMPFPEELRLYRHRKDSTDSVKSALAEMTRREADLKKNEDAAKKEADEKDDLEEAPTVETQASEKVPESPPSDGSPEEETRKEGHADPQKKNHTLLVKDKDSTPEESLADRDDNKSVQDTVEQLMDSTLLLAQERDSVTEAHKALDAFIDTVKNEPEALKNAVNQVRQIKGKLNTHNKKLEAIQRDFYIVEIQWHKILGNCAACIIMFLIGAPLGAIIKRGGLGMPVLISILFFIVYYVINMTGEKWAKQGAVDPAIGMWAANALLLPIGLFFLRQARNDARLFDADFYNVLIERLNTWLGRKKRKIPDAS